MKKPSILIVEDEALIAANLFQILSSLGYTVQKQVETGEDAILAVKTQKPDLVLMDIELIGAMNGIEVAEKIRSIADIPIVYLTAYTDDLRLKQAQLTEPYGYIVKPANNRELHATIGMALYKHALDLQLRASEERYRAIYEKSPIAIELYDITGALVHVNPACLKLFGIGDIQAIHNISLFADPNINNEDEEKLLKGETVHYEGPFDFEKGKILSLYPTSREGTIWLDVLITPLGESVDSITGFLVQIQDITGRRQAEESLSQANKKLSLLSGITRHDINNKLTVMKGCLTLLKNEQPSLVINEYFLKVITAAQRISAIILFTKQYEEIGVKAPTWQDCRKLVDTAAKQVQIGQVMVKNDFPAGAEVFADPLIVRVCYNLIDNAVRYGGKITTILFTVENRDGYEVIVCEDDGDGIVEDEKEIIFERGFGKNTGLGLFLIREILAITGMTIQETGEPGKGARFEITVPNGNWRFKSL